MSKSFIAFQSLPLEFQTLYHDHHANLFALNAGMAKLTEGKPKEERQKIYDLMRQVFDSIPEGTPPSDQPASVEHQPA